MTATATRFSMMALVASLILPACAAEDMGDELASNESAMTTADFLAQAQIVGSLDYGQTSATVSYKSVPKFRAFKFAGDAGDHVVVDVKSVNGGDAVAYLLDDSFVTIASNDDASATTLDSHIDVVLPAHPSRTHYIVFRDYGYRAKKFVVTLAGQPQDLKACTTDADCTRVNVGCCPASGFTAVRVGAEQAYRDSLQCPADRVCIQMMPYSDDVAQCDNNSHQCVLVDPLAIACGGHTRNMHECPEGYVCEGAGLKVDATGACRKPCGGFGATQCDNGGTCVDDPTDECDVEHGGADCGGICQPKTCGGFGNVQCPDGLACIDDPNDGCDVQNGGRDCGGICVIK